MELVFSRVPFHAYPFKSLLDNNKVFIITDNRFINEYKMNNSNVFGFDNYVENDEVLQKAIEICKKNDIYNIHVVDESDIERAAMLRELFNLKGQKMFSAILYRDKFLMKEVLKNKIKVPTFASVSNTEMLKKFQNKMKKDIVLKPRKSWSSNKMRKIELNDDVEVINIPENFMVEEWIDSSKMYTVDGIQKNGEIINFYINEYDRNVLESLLYNKKGFAMMTSDKNNDVNFRKEVEIYLTEIISVLNNGDNFTSPFHLEFFYDHKRGFQFCEIACRFGGGKTMELIHKAFGVSIPQMYVEMSTSNQNVKVVKSEVLGSINKYFVCYKKYNEYLSDKQIDKFRKFEWINKIIVNNKIISNNLPYNINDIGSMYLFEGDSREDCIKKVNIIENINTVEF